MTKEPQKIKYLDGIRFKRAINAAAKRLIEKHGHLNAINVFPVPDGDTGSNMAGTMKSIVDSSAESKDGTINGMSKVIADSALMGARGNSGVILAQFLCGFSEGVKDLKRVSPPDFIKASSVATKRAVESIANPKEGTILTVIREWSEHLTNNADKYKDFQHLLQDSLRNARESVQQTTEKLASLKAADVVDAGGLGFLYLLEGIVEFTERGSLNKSDTIKNDVVIEETEENAQSKVAVDSLEFRFCTECMIKGTDINTTTLREKLGQMGDSLVVAGTAETVRVHVHTNQPEAVFAIAAEFGTVDCRKADDMLAQHLELTAGKGPKVGIVTDSTCDLPDELMQEYGIRFAPLRLFLDDEEYIDKLSISTGEFNKRLRVSRSARTSQPAPADFKHLYDDMQALYDEVVSLHVMAKYSGTLQSAATIGKASTKPVYTVDSQTLSCGLGLVVLEAAKRARSGMSAEKIMAAARKDIKNLHVYVAMDTLDFAVRGGRMSRGVGAIAKLLNIKPVLEFDARDEGTVKVVEKGLGRRMAELKLLRRIEKAISGRSNPRIAIAHVAAEESAEHLGHLIAERVGIAPLYTIEASPVLGTHSGPGACAVAVLTD
ncbi:DAK2 domain-containing protein [Oleidesulfovibrio sp.]|uniref:DAK2 domain-containing protein n=1 Tax=Oleidesulfovibrio sp. TaxID=2909707 RepID=UPI003A8AA308